MPRLGFPILVDQGGTEGSDGSAASRISNMDTRMHRNRLIALVGLLLPTTALAQESYKVEVLKEALQAGTLAVAFRPLEPNDRTATARTAGS